jgi:hypothetical protein
VTSDPPSLCVSCTFVRVVHGRNDERYLLCRNETIPEKYPRQPVIACPGYEARLETVDDQNEPRS